MSNEKLKARPKNLISSYCSATALLEVASSLCFKSRISAKSHFHKKDFTQGLVLKPRVLELGNKLLVKPVFRSVRAVVTDVALSLQNLPKVILLALLTFRILAFHQSAVSLETRLYCITFGFL